MKIVLIGTNGFLSSAIGKYCEVRRHELHCFGLRPPIGHKYDSFKTIELLNEIIPLEAVRDAQIIIYAVGAGVQSNKNESSNKIYLLNTFVPINIIKLLEEANFRGVFITFGSYFEYGPNKEDKVLTEEDIINCNCIIKNDYSLSKRLLTKFTSSYAKTIKHWHFILPTIYGENEERHRLIPYILDSIKRKEDIKLTSGEQIREYLYVEEVPNIILKAIEENLPTGIYNLSSGDVYKVKDIVHLLFSKIGVQLDENIFASASRNDEAMNNLQLDGSKINSYINRHNSNKLNEVLIKYLNKWEY